MLMINSLAAQGKGDAINKTYRELTTDGKPES